MDEEKRRHPRVALDIQVSGAGTMIAHTRDVSKSGICLIGEEGLPEGKILNLQFSLPGDEETIHAFGKVMWSRKAGDYHHETGVEFWQIDDEAREKLLRFLAQRLDGNEI